MYALGLHNNNNINNNNNNKTTTKKQQCKKTTLRSHTISSAAPPPHAQPRTKRPPPCYGEFLFTVIIARTVLGLVSNLVFIGRRAPAAPFMIISLTNNEYLLSWTIVSNRCRAAKLIRDKDL